MKLPLWRFAIYALVNLTGVAISLPTFLPQKPSHGWPTVPVSLGLDDMRSGASLTLRADEMTIRTRLVSNNAAALAEAAPAFRSTPKTDAGGLTVSISDGSVAKAALDAARTTLPAVTRGPLSQAEPFFDLKATDGRLTATLRASAVAMVQADAVSRSIEVIRKRIGEAGVAEPSIQSLVRDRILVKMSGGSDPESRRSLLGAKAQLTFHSFVPKGTEGACPNWGGDWRRKRTQPAISASTHPTTT